MSDPEPQVQCPACHTAITVESGWRLVQCPRCGEMITRMSGDSAYD